MNNYYLEKPGTKGEIITKFFLWPIMFLIIMSIVFWTILSLPESQLSDESAAGSFVLILLWFFILFIGWIGTIVSYLFGAKRLSIVLNRYQKKITGRVMITIAWLSLLAVMIIYDAFFKGSSSGWIGMVASSVWMFMAIPAIVCGSILGRSAKNDKGNPNSYRSVWYN